MFEEQPTNLVEDYNMENFELTKTEKIRILDLLSQGDIWGLEYLRDVLKERVKVDYGYEDVHDFVRFVIELNTMVAHGETFGGIAEKHYNEIFDLYYKMKMDLLELVGITYEDIENFNPKDVDKYYEEA